MSSLPISISPSIDNLKPRNRQRIAKLQEYARIAITNSTQTSSVGPISQADIVHKAEGDMSLDIEIAKLKGVVEELENEAKQLTGMERKLPPKPRAGDDESVKELYKKFIQLKELNESSIPTYKRLASQIGYVPDAKSPLNSLLAIEDTVQTIRELTYSLRHMQQRVDTLRSHIAISNSHLSDNLTISSSLKARISTLQSQVSEQEAIENDDKAIAKTVILRLKTKQKEYERSTSRFLRSLMQFVESRLAIMLLAEELGGPVVGDDLDILAEELLSGRGFNKSGKLLAGKNVDDTKKDGGGGQMTIEQMFKKQKRSQPADSDLESEAENDNQERGAADPISQKAQDMINLIEELLNATFSPSTSPYVDIEDSATVRFLVRAKVVDMHHRDAKKIKLIEWGKEIED